MTTQLTVALPGPIALVPAPKSLETLQRLRQRYPYVPDLSTIVLQLKQLAAAGGVPARIESQRTDNRLVVYGQDWFLSLYPSRFDDLYTIGYVDRLRCQDHDKLARGVLRLSPPDWHIYGDKAEILRRQLRYATYRELIDREWQRLARMADLPDETALPARYTRYLDDVDVLVDATREIEAARQRDAPALPYRDFRPTREKRYSGRGVYVFELARSVQLAAGRLVQVEDESHLRGKVLRLDGNELTVRFDTAIDHRQVPRQGTLREAPSETVYHKQREAVRMLRAGGGANPNLLPVLVDNKFTPFQPDMSARPAGPLDDDQARAFTRACAVPDVLLVQGPPGTGKSWTIAETAREYAARGMRVLVSSHTNRAVDNVLAKLPDTLLALRVGNEGSLTEFARTKMIESLAGDLQEQILARTAGLDTRLHALVEHDRIDRWLRLLTTELATAAHSENAIARHSAELAAADERITTPVRAHLAELEATLNHHAAVIGKLTPKADRWRERENRPPHGLLAPLHRWLANRRARTLARLAEATQAHVETTRAHRQAQAHLESLRANDPELRRLRQSSATAAKERDDALCSLVTARTEIERLTYGLVTPPAEATDVAGWAGFRDWCAMALPPLRARADLLREWRDTLARPAEQLYPELVRYADVVAATCIGVASSDLLTELEFDVAIVDEAGQISLPNLLVPLVRGKRAVLVGDHKQLPPFVEDEVRGHRLADLLVISAFETLAEVAPESHLVRLRVQRRMPEAVARFVSDRFYDGWLRTGVHRTHHDPLFRKAFAIVDTSDLPQGERAERGAGRSAWRGPGYDNQADLITGIVVHAVRAGIEWAVIVPYQAQAALIRRSLARQQLPESVVEDNVGTVDSFQGGERDLVIYGCTRSNGGGQVGFLSELRRFNVAITRSKEQLVVVGDLRTLTNATDDGVRELMVAMVDHVRTYGDLRPSRTLRGAS